MSESEHIITNLSIVPRFREPKLVGGSGLEPLASCMSSRRSSQLS